MKPVWHVSLRCLVIALCLVAGVGCSAPSDYPAAGGSALVCCTPNAAASFSEEELQAPANDLEAAATINPSLGLPTPVLVFFTPETGPSVSQEAPDASATDLTPPVAELPSPGLATPAPIFFTPTADQTSGTATPIDAGTPGIPPAGEAGSPALQFTRVALQMTPSVTFMPRGSGTGGTPRATDGSSTSSTPDEAPYAQWPNGWWLAAGAVLAIIFFAWLLAGRRT